MTTNCTDCSTPSVLLFQSLDNGANLQTNRPVQLQEPQEGVPFRLENVASSTPDAPRAVNELAASEAVSSNSPPAAPDPYQRKGTIIDIKV